MIKYNGHDTLWQSTCNINDGTHTTLDFSCFCTWYEFDVFIKRYWMLAAIIIEIVQHWKALLKNCNRVEVQAMEMLCCGKLQLSKWYQMIGFIVYRKWILPGYFSTFDNCDPAALYLEFNVLALYQTVSMVDINLQQNQFCGLVLFVEIIRRNQFAQNENYLSNLFFIRYIWTVHTIVIIFLNKHFILYYNGNSTVTVTFTWIKKINFK